MKIIKMTKNNLEVKEIKHSLESYYKELNCSCIDIITIDINNKTYDMIIDDEGKLKMNHQPILIWITPQAEVVDYLATSCLICNYKHTEEGTIETSLTQKDIDNIMDYFRIFKEQDMFIKVL